MGPTDAGKTELFTDAWLPPVDRPEELPTGAAEGAMCFVTGERRVWLVQDGRWQAVGPPRPPEAVTRDRSST